MSRPYRRSYGSSVACVRIDTLQSAGGSAGSCCAHDEFVETKASHKRGVVFIATFVLRPDLPSFRTERRESIAKTIEQCCLTQDARFHFVIGLSWYRHRSSLATRIQQWPVCVSIILRSRCLICRSRRVRRGRLSPLAANDRICRIGFNGDFRFQRRPWSERSFLDPVATQASLRVL